MIRLAWRQLVFREDPQWRSSVWPVPFCLTLSGNVWSLGSQSQRRTGMCDSLDENRLTRAGCLPVSSSFSGPVFPGAGFLRPAIFPADKLPAPSSTMAESRHLARRLRNAACGTPGNAQDRLVSRSRGQRLGARTLRRRKNRPKSHGSAQVGKQAPYDHRCQRHPIGLHSNRGEPSRCYPIAASARQNSARQRKARCSALSARPRSRRPRL